MTRAFGLGALFAAWIAAGLFAHDPWKPDEAYTFGLVYHILEGGDWLVPTLAGVPFVEKPPLFYWTAALFGNALPGLLPLHDAARLASAFYVALTLAFTYLIAKDWCQSPIAAPLVLAGSLGYLQHAHQLITDNALMAGIALGLLGLARSSGLLLGTGAGIAFLSKGVLGPGLLGLTTVGLLLFREWRTRAYLRSWLVALGAFLPWALIWPTALYLRSPALFNEWFWVNNFGRFTGEAGLGGVLDHAHYAKALVWFALPAWPLAFVALANDRLRSPLVQLGTLAFIVMFAVLSAASSARTLYGLPLLIPLALLAAVGLESVPRWLAWPMQAAVAVAGVVGLLLWLGWLALLTGRAPASLEAYSPGFAPTLEPVALGGAIVISALWVLSWRLSLPARWLAGVTLVWGLAMTLWLGWLDHAKSYRGVIADMQRALPKGGCVATRNLTEPQRAMFHYHAGIRAPTPPDCPWLLIHTPGNQTPAPGDPWKLAWRGTRPGDTKEFFWLFRREG